MRTRTRAKVAFSETRRAVRTVKSASVRADLASQLLHVERALGKSDNRKVTAYLHGLVTAVLILRRSLSARIATNVLSGIDIDCETLGIVLPLINYTDRSRCVFNTGNCTRARFSKCVKIDTAWGCGTVPRRQAIA
jgi:hypothetical protein